MVGQPSLALALLGLGAVQALPTQQPKETVEKRAPQIFGPPSTSFGPGDLPKPNVPCSPLTDSWCWWPVTSAPPTTNEGDRFGFGAFPRSEGDAADKTKRDSVDEIKREIIELERRLQDLQNLQDKSREDWEEIRWLRRELERKVGIVRIIAPPGTVTTFTPGKRDVDGDKTKRDSVDEIKREIIELERRLQDLQNLQDKSREDWEEIRWLRRELERKVGIVRIIAPPGTVTTFTPGKRDVDGEKEKRQGLIFPGGGGQGNYDPSACPSLNEAARILDKLLSYIDRGRLPQWAENEAVRAYEVFLDGCNMALEETEDDQGVLIEVYRKGDHAHSGGHRLWPRADAAADEQFDVTGLQTAHDVLIETLGGTAPSIATWMVLKQIEAEIAAHGGAPAVAKRQGSGGIIAIGEGACQLADILALKAALAALGITYGNDRSKTPPSVFLVEQVIVSALQICRQDVPGWTTFTPGNPLPGGPLVPAQPVQGGPLVPERPAPGGSLEPSRPGSGGPIIGDRPGEGGRIIPDRPGEGGRIIPDRPGDGGRIKPSD